MNRREALSLAVVAISGFALSTFGAVSQPKALKDQLVGNWSFVSGSIEATDGKKTTPWGADPKGTLTFTGDGHFTLKNERPTVQSYTGTYTVTEADKTITRKYDGTPGGQPSEFKSAVNLAGDNLTLIDQDPQAGKTQLVYTRAK